MRSLKAAVEGVGLLGPGLPDWPGAREALAGRAEYVYGPTILLPPAGLPPAERRRASAVVKLAMAIAWEATASAGADVSALPSVFCSSSGDGFNCHEICEALASRDRFISPTRFHNSVNNAPAGYWGIAAHCMASASVLCGYDASFGAGLLEAATQAVVERTRVLLVAYDAEYPEPLRALRPIRDAFGVALVLSPECGARSLCALSIGFSHDRPDRLPHPALEALRQNTPIARALPLLRAIALGGKARVALDYLAPQRLAVEVEPWP
jgi:hypothetical protein